MKSIFLDLFHIPTWCYKFITVASVLAVGFNVYWFVQVGNLEFVVIEGVRYGRDTLEYSEAIKDIKLSMVFSTSLAFVAGLFSYRVISKRRDELLDTR